MFSNEIQRKFKQVQHIPQRIFEHCASIEDGAYGYVEPVQLRITR